MPRFVRLSSIAAVAFLLTLTSSCAAPDPAPPGDAAQGWDAAARAAWYTTSQGSRLIPQAWLDNLEQPDNTGMFLDPAYINTFRYLPNQTANWTSPDKTCPFDKSLPLGFAVDCQSDKGLTGTSWPPPDSSCSPRTARVATPSRPSRKAT